MPRMKQRRRTESEWANENPVLLDGEFGVETDTGRIKVGDGSLSWSALSYFGGTTTPSNTTDPTALTSQTPNTLVASSTLTFAASVANVTWPVTTSGGVGVEISTDGGYSWQVGGTVGVGGTVQLRALTPNYGSTDTITLTVGGRSYSWSITSRSWDYDDDMETTALVDLRKGAAFWQDAGRSVAATAEGDPVYVWDQTNGVGYASAASTGTRLALTIVSGSRMVKGSGADSSELKFPHLNISPIPSTWFWAMKCRLSASSSGGYFGTFSNAARFYANGSATAIGYYDDATGANLTGFTGPGTNTFFFLGVRYTAGGVTQIKVHQSAWTTIGTAPNNYWGTTNRPRIGCAGDPMVATQQVSDVVMLPFDLDAAGVTSLVTKWGVSQ